MWEMDMRKQFEIILKRLEHKTPIFFLAIVYVAFWVLNIVINISGVASKIKEYFGFVIAMRLHWFLERVPGASCAYRSYAKMRYIANLKEK